MSGFSLGEDSRSISSADDEDNLPYPEALPRNDFLTTDFDAPTYLSTLSERHQTLEDLRVDLRERSKALSKELLDLVNFNYEQFLSLGSHLQGGEEKIEDVRVGLLGFKRGIEEVRTKVWERAWEVDRLLGEKTVVNKQINLGRKLLESHSRIEELEERLMVMVSPSEQSGVNGVEETWNAIEDEEVDDVAVGEDSSAMTTVKKLRCLVNDYLQIRHTQSTIVAHNPYLVSQEARMIRIRNTLLLDLSTALKQAYSANSTPKLRVQTILEIYSEMGEYAEAIKVLRDQKIQINGNGFEYS